MQNVPLISALISARLCSRRTALHVAIFNPLNRIGIVRSAANTLNTGTFDFDPRFRSPVLP